MQMCWSYCPILLVVRIFFSTVALSCALEQQKALGDSPSHKHLERRRVDYRGGGCVVMLSLSESVAPRDRPGLPMLGRNVLQRDWLFAPVLDFESLLHARRRRPGRRVFGDVDDTVVVSDDSEIFEDGREPVLGIWSAQSMLYALGRAGSELVRRENLRSAR